MGNCGLLGGALLALLVAGYFGRILLPVPKPQVIGIDLGTTFSCAAYYESGTGIVYMLPDATNHSCIPSIVSFTPWGIFVGRDAKPWGAKYPESTIYDAKRFIGKSLTKDAFEKESKRYPFKLELQANNSVLFVVSVNGTTRRYSPVDIGHFVVSQLKKNAEVKLQKAVKACVMAVPADFDSFQRNETQRATTGADVEVWRVLSEPTAASMAYGLHKRSDAHQVMVLDIGGGTTDVSLLHVRGGTFMVQAVAGNNHLGGQDFTERILQKFRSTLPGDLSQKDVHLLRGAADEAKIRLSLEEKVTLEEQLEHVKFTYTLSRDDFEKINEDLFREILVPIDAALHNVELTPEEVDEVILVGGSTRMPRVRDIIAEHFGKRPNTAVDPDEAIVTGLAVQAGILSGAWPVQVSAVESPAVLRKIHVVSSNSPLTS